MRRWRCGAATATGAGAGAAGGTGAGHGNGQGCGRDANVLALGTYGLVEHRRSGTARDPELETLG
jgi:hypothetical protein